MASLNVFLLCMAAVGLVAGFAGWVIHDYREASAESPSNAYPYWLKQSIVGGNELAFFRACELALGVDYKICPKVRLLDIFGINDGLDFATFDVAEERLMMQRIDFLICNKKDLAPVLAIALKSVPYGQKGKTTNETLRTVCDFANLPFLEVESKTKYTASQVFEMVSQKLGLSQDNNGQTTPPMCPECGAVTVKRQVKSGRSKGKIFWGCINFPNCRGVAKAPSTESKKAKGGQNG